MVPSGHALKEFTVVYSKEHGILSSKACLELVRLIQWLGRMLNSVFNM